MSRLILGQHPVAAAGKGPGERRRVRFEEALARWLRQSLRGPDGRDRMTHSAVIKNSKVGRATFYRILGGEGQDVDEATLRKLAAALKVPAPQIERVLRLDQPDSPLQVPTLAKLKEAEALMAEAIAALGGRPSGHP